MQAHKYVIIYTSDVTPETSLKQAKNVYEEEPKS